MYCLRQLCFLVGFGLVVCSLGCTWIAQAMPQKQVKVLNLNHAPVRDLIRLPGIGLSRAKLIASYRRDKPFERAIELLKIPGIGRKTYVRLRPWISVVFDNDKRLTGQEEGF